MFGVAQGGDQDAGDRGQSHDLLAQRGQAKRTLIITPAGLTTQWQEEMADKFGAHFEIFGRDFLAVNPRIWEYKAAAIASIDRLPLSWTCCADTLSPARSSWAPWRPTPLSFGDAGFRWA